MAQLKAELEALGYDDVSTYINSGNALFTAAGKEADLAAEIEARLEKAFGFEIPTFLRTAKEVEHLANTKPFGTIADGHTHLVALLSLPLTAAQRAATEALSNDTDQLVVDGNGRDIHWLIHGKQMDSTLKPKDWKAVGDRLTTTRNATMIRKLLAKL